MSVKEGLKKFLPLIFASGALLLLLVMPDKADEAKQSTNDSASAEDKIMEAVGIIEAGTDPMKGILMLREVLEKDPQNVQAIQALGHFSLVSGQASKAETRFRDLLRLQPDNPEGWFNLGEALEMKKDSAEARLAFQKAKDLFREPADKQKADEALARLRGKEL